MIPELGRYPGERNGYPLQHASLENFMDRGAWLATVHGVTEADMTEQLWHGVSVGYANGVWVCAAHGEQMRGGCVWCMDM